MTTTYTDAKILAMSNLLLNTRPDVSAAEVMRNAASMLFDLLAERKAGTQPKGGEVVDNRKLVDSIKASSGYHLHDGTGASDALYNLAVKHGASETEAAGFAHHVNGSMNELQSCVYNMARLASQPPQHVNGDSVIDALDHRHLCHATGIPEWPSNCDCPQHVNGDGGDVRGDLRTTLINGLKLIAGTDGSECWNPRAKAAELLEAFDAPTPERLREEFERAITSPPFEKDVSRYPLLDIDAGWPGNYKAIDVELAWCMWVAAHDSFERGMKDAVPFNLLSDDEVEWLNYAIVHMNVESDPDDKACAESIQQLLDRTHYPRVVVTAAEETTE